MLDLEDRQRVLALEDMDRSKDRPRGRQPTPSGPPIALGDRAASSSGGPRRPETLEEKRARFEKQYRKKKRAAMERLVLKPGNAGRVESLSPGEKGT